MKRFVFAPVALLALAGAASATVVPPADLMPALEPSASPQFPDPFAPALEPSGVPGIVDPLASPEPSLPAAVADPFSVPLPEPSASPDAALDPFATPEPSASPDVADPFVTPEPAASPDADVDVADPFVTAVPPVPEDVGPVVDDKDAEDDAIPINIPDLSAAPSAEPDFFASPAPEDPFVTPVVTATPEPEPEASVSPFVEPPPLPPTPPHVVPAISAYPTTTPLPSASSAAAAASPAAVAPKTQVAKGVDACARAFAACNLRFDGFRASLPTFDISGPADVAFTPALVWKDDSVRVGVANSNAEGDLITDAVTRRFSQWVTGAQDLSPSQFKTFPLNGAPFSAVGHETFQGNEPFARGKCVRVRITNYQTLDASNPPNVSGNVNDAHECVVFRTKA